jgi:simple sugar transport system substrate-binding protein
MRTLRLLAATLVTISLLGVAHAQEKLRFIIVTHGAASDRFWGMVKEGADRAAAEMNVGVDYRAPEEFDLKAMTDLLSAAVQEKPDGLVVSIPNADAVAAPIQAAVEAGIPVVTINSGFDVGRSLGALLHVGQSEYEAGRVAGETMRKLGGNKALCVNHELGNVGLDLRCKGFIDGFAGSVEVMPVEADAEEAGKAIADRLTEDSDIDVVLTLSANIAGEPAIAAAQALGEGREVRVASFDVTDAVLKAVADGDAAFAIDQQPFLQGYLPVEILTLLKRYSVVPVSNVSTGPRLITLTEARQRLGRSDAEGSDGEASPTESPDSGGG